MTTLADTLDEDEYDEFGLLPENAAEWDLPLDRVPQVTRQAFTLPSGETVSYLRWGEAEPELVFLHGAAQNAHTWDTVLLALGRPALALDLPGHGRSDWRPDRDYGPWRNAEVVAALLEERAPAARAVVGMSNGGASTIRLASQRPDLCRRAVLVDATPQLYERGRALETGTRTSVSLAWGPPVYDSFEDMARAAVAQSPLRPAGGVRIGVRHNARRLDDGRWEWRNDRFRTQLGPAEGGGLNEPEWFDMRPLWADVDLLSVPTLLVRGALSPFIHDEDVDEMRRRLPELEVVVVEGAGHAVQSDRPLEVAAAINAFVP